MPPPPPPTGSQFSPAEDLLRSTNCRTEKFEKNEVSGDRPEHAVSIAMQTRPVMKTVGFMNLRSNMPAEPTRPRDFFFLLYVPFALSFTLPPLRSSGPTCCCLCHSKLMVRKMASAASRSFRLSEVTDISKVVGHSHSRSGLTGLTTTYKAATYLRPALRCWA
jgi:hypothetical protein